MAEHFERPHQPMRRGRVSLLIALYWKPVVAMLLVSAGAFVLSAWAIRQALSTPPLPTTQPVSASSIALLTAASATAASLSASAVWFGVAYLYSRGFMRIVQEYASLESFPIEKFINGSHRIEVNVHGWDGLFVGRGGDVNAPLSTERGQLWRKFFDDDGTLVLMLPKVPEGARNHAERTELEQALSVVARRNGKTLEAQIDEIKSTLRVANAIRGNKGVVEPRDHRHLHWICTIKFDNHHLLVSPYTQRHQSAPFEAPVFLINLHAYEKTRTWVELIHGRDRDMLEET